MTILFFLEEQELVWQENSSQFGSTDALQHDERNKVSPLSRSLKDLGPVSRKSGELFGPKNKPAPVRNIRVTVFVWLCNSVMELVVIAVAVLPTDIIKF